MQIYQFRYLYIAMHGICLLGVNRNSEKGYTGIQYAVNLCGAFFVFFGNEADGVDSFNHVNQFLALFSK